MALLRLESVANFWRDGYLLLRSALTAGEVARCLHGVRAAAEAYDGLAPADRGSHDGLAGNRSDLRLLRTVELTAGLDFLLDHGIAFDTALALIGPYVQVVSTEILVRRPRDDTPLPLHVDGGPSLGGVLPHPDGKLTHLKALYFLTDVTSKDQGNVVVLPGSHTRPSLTSPSADASSAVQLEAEAGDLLLFPWSLWHGVAPNRSSSNRVSVVVWYAQLWARPIDYQSLRAETLGRLTPRQRLLFGDIELTPNMDRYYMPGTQSYLSTMLDHRQRGSSEIKPYLNADEVLDRGNERR